MKTLTRARLLRALQQAGANKAAAARLLGISRPTLYTWIRQYSQNPPDSEATESTDGTVKQNTAHVIKNLDRLGGHHRLRSMQTAQAVSAPRKVAITLSPRHRAILKRLAVEQAIRSGRGRDSMSEVVAGLLERADRDKPERGRAS